MKTTTAILVAAFLATAVGAPPVQSGAPHPAPAHPALRPADYQPAGDYCDWRKTGQPERPWFHKYHQSLLIKIFFAEGTDGGRGCKVCLTFEQAVVVNPQSGLVLRLFRNFLQNSC